MPPALLLIAFFDHGPTGVEMKVDHIVIGSGQAGVPLAARLAEAGRDVIIVESGHLGGSCVNVGCTPTKTMVASARAAHVAQTAGRLGVTTGNVEVDLAAVVDRKNSIVEQWRSGVRHRLERAGDRLKLIEGKARFVGRREIEVNGQRHSAESVIINVGASPRIPAIGGLDSVRWLDSSSIMDVRKPPERLVIMGGGYIACEFGQMFRRFGSEVTIMQRGEHLLAREDEEVSEAIEEAFRAEGIEVVLGAEVIEVAKRKDGIVVKCGGGQQTEGSQLLVAVGRVPSTYDLECAAAGVELDRRATSKWMIAFAPALRVSVPWATATAVHSLPTIPGTITESSTTS